MGDLESILVYLPQCLVLARVLELMDPRLIYVKKIDVRRKKVNFDSR